MTTTLLKVMGFPLFFGAAFYIVYSMLPKKKEQDAKKKLQDEEVNLGEGARFVNLFRPFFEIFIPLIKLLPLSGYRTTVEQYAVTAGMEKEFTGDDFIGFQITTALLFAVMLAILFKSIPISLVGIVAGFAYPYLWIYERKKARQAEILASMPDVVDTLALAVAAGLDFNAASKRVCDMYMRDNDPFVAELYLMNKNIRLGRSREEALLHMGKRVDLQELYAFTTILIQSEKMGSSISEVLKAQAIRMREERFMRAEQAGAVISQKLLLPLIVCIFPIIFIITLGPFILKYIYR